jgi:hypothetical protein
VTLRWPVALGSASVEVSLPVQESHRDQESTLIRSAAGG